MSRRDVTAAGRDAPPNLSRVRTHDAHEGHRSFTGELVGASDAEVTIAGATGVLAIAYDDITRSNLVED